MTPRKSHRPAVRSIVTALTLAVPLAGSTLAVFGFSSLAVVVGGTSALAQTDVTRSGPESSHAPVLVDNGRVDFVLVERGALIGAAPDGAAIRNAPAGRIGTAADAPPPFISRGLTIDASTIDGAIVNQGTIESRPDRTSENRPGVLVRNSTVTGGIDNTGFIGSTVGNGVDVIDSRVAGGIRNSGLIVGSEFGGVGISIAGGTVAGGLANSSALGLGIDLEAATFSGGVVNTGTLTSPVIGGGTFNGGLTNRGTISGDLTIGSAIFNGNVVNAGTAQSEGFGGPTPSAPGGMAIGITVAAGQLNGNIVNTATGELAGNTGLFVDGPVSGAVENGGLLHGVTVAPASDHGTVAGVAIRLGPDGAIGGGIVNTGRLVGGAVADEGLPAAIDLTAATHPTVIAQKGGFIYGDIRMNQIGPDAPADTLRAEGGQIIGDVYGDAGDRLMAVPGGTVLVSGIVDGFNDVSAEAGRSIFAGPIRNTTFLRVGSVAGTPATLALGSGQTSHVRNLLVYADGTLASEVTAAGAAGRVVAGSAIVRGTLEIDVLPGSYRSTTVYDDVVAAPGLGTSARTTFKRVTTNDPRFVATVTYDNGTADVTLTRSGVPRVASATLAGPQQIAAAGQASDASAKVGRTLAARARAAGIGSAAGHEVDDRGGRNRSGGSAQGRDRGSARAGHDGGGRHGRG